MGKNVIFVPWDICIRRGKVFSILSLTFGGRGGGGGWKCCNQVSRSRFSQLQIIIWFRYLILALKLKTCLEITNALLSHRLQRNPPPPISSYRPGHRPRMETWKPFVLSSLRKGKGIKLYENAYVWHSFVSDIFFFLSKASKWKGRANRSLAPSPLPETEWGLQNFLLLCSYLGKA